LGIRFSEAVTRIFPRLRPAAVGPPASVVVVGVAVVVAPCDAAPVLNGTKPKLSKPGI